MSTSPYAIVHFFPEGTREQYEASIAAVHPGPGQLPAGQIYHAAGPSEGGFTITAIHDSQASWEKFRDDILMPKMQAGITGGFTSEPILTSFPVVNLVTSQGREVVLT